MSFTLEVRNPPAGQVAVYPRTIAADAPSYMLAFAAGEYAHASLGETAAGTEVGVWFLPGGESAALFGTRDLVAVFDWLERTLGEYAFGNTVGSVAAWHPNSAGGIEHHPYWHIGRAAMSDSLVHAHEAAHGWFGNGVRMRCWEDFVLSEGTATYLAARGLGAAAGDEVESAIWAEYQQRLEQAVAQGDTIAWPQSCDAIDILEHPIFSSVPYLKGAFFLRAVESEVGRVALDPALARFYELHRGRAAGMQDLLDTLAAETGFDPTPLAAAWLRGLGIPPG
jgi:aminopeptidase N